MSTDSVLSSVLSISAEQKAKAEEFKQQGNKYFNESHFHQAEVCYSQAIDTDPTNPIYYSNRAFCHLKLEEYGSAIEDATKAIEIDKNFIKAYYRRGAAYLALTKFKEARKDFVQVTKIKPSDKDAKVKLQECEKAIREEAFLKAIEGERTKPASESVDVKSIEVESSYDGPRLGDDNKVTKEFVDALIERYKNQKRLHKRYVYEILMQIISLLSKLPTLVDIDVPQGTEITLCGDVHGQFYDVCNIFQLNGFPSEQNPYLFNGDFVDRGSFSVEVIMTFFALKLVYPNHFHLTRGNHESINMNNMYGFQGEVVAKVDAKAFELFTEAFNWLPLCAVVGKKIFVVHGGLCSEDGVTLDQIKKIDRCRQPPENGVFCDLLWADPSEQKGKTMSKRGVGLSFGPDITAKFLEHNNLTMIVRSHEVKDEGYEVTHDGKLVTLFSAPNYCLAAGTRVTLADGTSLPIEQIAADRPTALLSYEAQSPAGASPTASASSSRRPSLSAADDESLSRSSSFSLSANQSSMSSGRPSDLQLTAREVLEIDSDSESSFAAPSSVSSGRPSDRQSTGSNGGLSVRHTTGRHRLDQGVKECIQVLLEDGRKLECTPDHRIITRQGEMQAKDLKPGVRVLATGLPRESDESPQAHWSWTVANIGSFQWPQQRVQILALARVAGYVLTDGYITVSPGVRGNVWLGHELDRKSFIDDLRTIFNNPTLVVGTLEPEASNSSEGTYRVSIPADLCRALLDIGIPPGKKLGQGEHLPAVMLAPNTPLDVKREFLGALFGGDGTTPTWNSSSGGWTPIRFSASVPANQVNAAVTAMEQELGGLLGLFGISSAVKTAECKSELSSAGSWQVILELPTAEIEAFDRCIGFRHCVHKAQKLAIVAGWCRGTRLRQEQKKRLCDDIIDRYNRGSSWKDAINAAVNAMKRTEVMFDGIIPSVPSISMINSGKNDPMKNQTIYSKGDAYLRAIGADSWFNMGDRGGRHTYGVSRTDKTVPVWSLGVVGQRAIGPRPTYDLSVRDTHLFIAEGLVVHNCDQMGNKGAYARVNSAGEVKYTQFSAVPHPPVAPMQYASPMMRGGFM